MTGSERRLTATDARVRFGAVMEQVMSDRLPVVVEKGGKPTVAIVAYAELAALQQEAGGAAADPMVELANGRQGIAFGGRVGARTTPDRAVKAIRGLI